MPRRTPVATVRTALEKVPVVGQPAIRTLAAIRLAVGPSRGSAGGVDGHPRRFVTRPAPGPIPETWPTPPTIDRPMAAIEGGRESADDRPGVVFDVDLFDSLNAEYADRPLVAEPQRYDDASLLERAQIRLSAVHRTIDLRRGPVLEFGCGAGYEIWRLSHAFDVAGWGVDIQERQAWASLADARTQFVCADLATDRPFEADYFERVVSFTVFEHVDHPYAALEELFRVMKPGGLAWIKANLYRGPMASHRYRWINFPFPHLLFTDEVLRESCRRHDRPEQGAAWVNRLSWADYESYLRRIGFRIRLLRFQERPLDEAFYARFEDILGRYPRTDLTRDFFEVVLEKPHR